MTLKTLGISAGALLLAGAIGYGAGRYATPAKVVTVTKTETKTEIQWKDRIVEKVVAGPVRTVTHTVERLVPCVPGETTPVTDTTTTVDAGPVIIDRVGDSAGASTSATLAVTTSTTTHDQPRLMLQVGTGLRLKPDVGASYRFAGPVWLGASYDTDAALALKDRFRLRVSLTF